MDKRLLRVDIKVGNNLNSYEDIEISASGSKVSNEIPNEFTIKLTNLTAENRNRILTETNILERGLPNKKIYVYAGRESTGYSLVYSGDIRQVQPSQPPNISLTIQTYTGDQAKLQTSIRGGKDLTLLSVLSRQIASGLGLNLVFEATDKQIASYSYSGSKLKEIEKLNEAASVNAYIDNDNLIVRNKNKALVGVTYDINKQNGMIGLPQINERGVSVKILLDTRISIGNKINITSEFNPNANGNWVVYKIIYDLQNRGSSFYMTLEATKDN